MGQVWKLMLARSWAGWISWACRRAKSMRTTSRWVWRSLDPWPNKPNAMGSMNFHETFGPEWAWSSGNLSTVRTICSSASMHSAGSAAKYRRCLAISSFQEHLRKIWRVFKALSPWFGCVLQLLYLLTFLIVCLLLVCFFLGPASNPIIWWFMVSFPGKYR